GDARRGAGGAGVAGGETPRVAGREEEGEVAVCGERTEVAAATGEDDPISRGIQRLCLRTQRLALRALPHDREPGPRRALEDARERLGQEPVPLLRLEPRDDPNQCLLAGNRVFVA